MKGKLGVGACALFGVSLVLSGCATTPPPQILKKGGPYNGATNASTTANQGAVRTGTGTTNPNANAFTPPDPNFPPLGNNFAPPQRSTTYPPYQPNTSNSSTAPTSGLYNNLNTGAFNTSNPDTLAPVGGNLRGANTGGANTGGANTGGANTGGANSPVGTPGLSSPTSTFTPPPGTNGIR